MPLHAIASMALLACNRELAVMEPIFDPPTVRSAPLVLLPQDKGNESPAALDGSPFGVYFVPSKTGSTKWTVFLEGGGWCYDEVDCLCRANSTLGSSTVRMGTSPRAACECMNPSDGGDGKMDDDCNCLHVPYLDGASFSGYRAEPVAVPGVAGATVTFRGIKNFDAAIEFALAHGMNDATEAVLSGSSAGGLSTFLHADRFSAAVTAAAPALTKVRAARARLPRLRPLPARPPCRRAALSPLALCARARSPPLPAWPPAASPRHAPSSA